MDVPVTALELKRFCHTTASVHCGIMYGKIKILLRYLRQARFVLVTRKAIIPPKIMDTTHAPTDMSSVFISGVHRFVFASLLVNRSM